MEHTRQQIREILAIRQAFISRGELAEEEAYYEKMEPLLARLQVRLEEDIRAKQEKLDADLAKAKIKAIKEMMEQKEVESKAYCEKPTEKKGKASSRR
jgi:hypothetical protein